MIYVAFGVASVFLSVVALFIPDYGTYIIGLSGIFAWCSVGRAMFLGLVSVIINISNILFFSKTFLTLLAIEPLQRTSEQVQLYNIWMFVFAIQLITLLLYALNGLFDFCVRKGYFQEISKNFDNRIARKKEKDPVSNQLTKQTSRINEVDQPPNNSETPVPSQLTEVLVRKLHGGRKGESRFWKSREGNSPTEQIGLKRRKRSLFSPSIIFASLSVCLLTGWFCFNYFTGGFDSVPLNRVYESSVENKTNNNASNYTPPKINKTSPDIIDKSTRSYPPALKGNTQNPKPQKRMQDSIYVQKDKDGRTHYSNTIPTRKKVSTRKSPSPIIYGHTMPVEISNNKVFIDVTIENNGKKLETSMEIDPTESKTIVPERLAKFLGMEKRASSKVYSSKNGRGIVSEPQKLDYLKVGQIEEKNVRVLKQSGSGAPMRGVLGGDFLRKHPYSIDSKKQTIIWAGVKG